MKKGRRFGDIVSNVYLILLSIVAVFPLLWLLVSAFKSSSEMLTTPQRSGLSNGHWKILKRSCSP